MFKEGVYRGAFRQLAPPQQKTNDRGQAAVLFARSTIACCCSETRRITVLYTFFFLVAEALFMKSANEELVDGDFLVGFIISSNLVTTQETFKRRSSIFFVHMAVNVTDIALIPTELIIPVLQ